MSLIKSLMGRRQFLIAAGVTSTSAMALHKLGTMSNPVFQTGAAIAAEKAGTAGNKAAGNRYSHLLSPVKIRKCNSEKQDHTYSRHSAFPARA